MQQKLTVIVKKKINFNTPNFAEKLLYCDKWFNSSFEHC